MKIFLRAPLFIFFILIFFLSSAIPAEDDFLKEKSLNQILEDPQFQKLSEEAKELVLEKFLFSKDLPKKCVCSNPATLLKDDKLNNNAKILGGWLVHCYCGNYDCVIALNLKETGVSGSPICEYRKQSKIAQ